MTTTHYDTIIVGGGISGLMTALKILTRHPRHKVVVLEKYKRLGGRTMTFDKDISGVGHVRWENGAGRIHSSHTRLLALIAKYKLHTAPISPATQFIDNLQQPSFEDLLPALLLPLTSLPAETLATSTLWDLARQLYGKRQAHSLFTMFPYYTELYKLRADLALKTFEAEMGTRRGYHTLKEGFSELIERIAEDVHKRGGEILPEHTLVNFKELDVVSGQGQGAKVQVTIKFGEEGATKVFTGGRLILALHAEALRSLKELCKWTPLKYLASAKLLRIYAVFPPNPVTGKVWFADMPRTITASPLRHIIPIDPSRGIIMISYTDERDTEPWFALADGKSPLLTVKIMEEVRRLFGEAVPEPLYLKAHPWTIGTTYWKPGKYDAEAMSVAAHRMGPAVYVVGEAISTHQAWVEGALESVETLMGMLYSK